MLRFLNDYYARLSIILLVGYSVFIASNLFSLESENKWLLHTLEVKQAIEKSLGSLRDIETGARGYQITGEDSFLEPYNSGLTSLPNQLDYLQKLIADNKSQVAMIPRLRQQSKDKIEVARALIKAKGSSDLDMAIRYVHEGKTPDGTRSGLPVRRCKMKKTGSSESDSTGSMHLIA